MIELVIILAVLAFLVTLAVKSAHTPEYRHLMRLEKAKRSWAKMLESGNEKES
jgi:Tfp pilus assembly protein PilE